MSRRQHTTVTFSVRIPLPAGATRKQAMEYTLRALIWSKESLHNNDPMAGVSIEGIQVKLINSTTVYL